MLQMSIMPFVVSFIVNKHTNEIQSIDVLYAVNAKKEPAGSLSPEVSTPPTGPTISIFNLLDCVSLVFILQIHIVNIKFIFCDTFYYQK